MVFLKLAQITLLFFLVLTFSQGLSYASSLEHTHYGIYLGWYENGIEEDIDWLKSSKVQWKQSEENPHLRELFLTLEVEVPENQKLLRIIPTHPKESVPKNISFQKESKDHRFEVLNYSFRGVRFQIPYLRPSVNQKGIDRIYFEIRNNDLNKNEIKVLHLEWNKIPHVFIHDQCDPYEIEIHPIKSRAEFSYLRISCQWNEDQEKLSFYIDPSNDGRWKQSKPTSGMFSMRNAVQSISITRSQLKQNETTEIGSETLSDFYDRETTYQFRLRHPRSLSRSFTWRLGYSFGYTSLRQQLPSEVTLSQATNHFHLSSDFFFSQEALRVSVNSLAIIPILFKVTPDSLFYAFFYGVNFNIGPRLDFLSSKNTNWYLYVGWNYQGMNVPPPMYGYANFHGPRLALQFERTGVAINKWSTTLSDSFAVGENQSPFQNQNIGLEFSFSLSDSDRVPQWNFLLKANYLDFKGATNLPQFQQFDAALGLELEF